STSLPGTTSTTLTVADAALTAGTATASTGGVEGVTATTLSATFTDANATTGATPSDFSGTIDWRDGTSSAVTSAHVTGSAASFPVCGPHTPPELGTYPTRGSTDLGAALPAAASATPTVADAALTAGTATASTGGVEGVTATTLRATFTDANATTGA